MKNLIISDENNILLIENVEFFHLRKCLSRQEILEPRQPVLWWNQVVFFAMYKTIIDSIDLNILLRYMWILKASSNTTQMLNNQPQSLISYFANETSNLKLKIISYKLKIFDTKISRHFIISEFY